MHPDQIALIQTTFAQALTLGDVVPELFYDRLFTLDPSLRRLFTGDMQEQGRKLVTMLTIVVRGLPKLEAILPAVQALGERHARYGVADEHYATVGAALLWTLGQGLGEAFTPEVETAWTAAYGVLADVMQTAAKVEPIPV